MVNRLGHTESRDRWVHVTCCSSAHLSVRDAFRHRWTVVEPITRSSQRLEMIESESAPVWPLEGPQRAAFNSSLRLLIGIQSVFSKSRSVAVVLLSVTDVRGSSSAAA